VGSSSYLTWQNKNFAIDRSLLDSNQLLAGTYSFDIRTNINFTNGGGYYKTRLFYWDNDLGIEVDVIQTPQTQLYPSSTEYYFQQQFTLSQTITLGPNQYL
jgi:hypothetical protein